MLKSYEVRVRATYDLVVAIGGGNYSAELVAYRLPGKA